MEKIISASKNMFLASLVIIPCVSLGAEVGHVTTSAPSSARSEAATLTATSIQQKLKTWHARKGTRVQKLNVFYDMLWNHFMIQSPEWATYQGFPGQNDRWSDRSIQNIEKTKEESRAIFKALDAYGEKGLTGEDLMTYRLLHYDFKRRIDGFQFPGEYLAISQMFGFHSQMANLFLVAPKKNLRDYQDILKRVATAHVVVDQVRVLLQEGLKRGITPPKVTLLGLPAQFDKMMPEKIEDSPLYEAFKEIKPAVLSTDQAQQIQAEARKLIETSLYPALKKMRVFLASEYIPGCREAIGWSNLPNGKNWYDSEIRDHTTVDLTAEQIHEIGLNEVKRIRTEMDKVREQVRFKGDFKKFNDSLNDSKFYFTRGEDLIERFKAIGKTIDPLLPQIFGKLPRLPYGVKEVPAYLAPDSAAGYYEGGKQSAGRPGYFYANTYDLKARPKWAMIDLTCHETVPGHHFQIAIAEEMESQPELRRNIGFTAFIEGWALYAESLCDELGLYKDPYDKYGQLTAEMWRAVRLVVDTGIHAKGWTREQTIQYFREAGPFSEQEIQSETNRYIVWAGQALAYKIGELKIKELRQKARTALGERFDVGAFHDQVLGSGSLPLPVLEKKINDWVQTQLKIDQTKKKVTS